MDLQCPENTVFKNLCSLRMLKGTGCEEVYTNLFETSSAWQVFKVGVSRSLRRFPEGRDSLEVKKIIKLKFLSISAATMAGRFYEWVGVFLEKRARDVFCRTFRLQSQSDSTMALFIFVKTMIISFVI